MRLEAICRQRLGSAISDVHGVDSGRFQQLQYMATVSSAADELGVEGVQFPHGYDDPMDGFSSFVLATTQAATRIRLRKSSRRDPYSVSLSTNGRERIRSQIARLKHSIESSDLEALQKRRAREKLDALSAEIERPRLRFGQAMAAVGGVAMIVVAGTSFLADAPDAFSTITSIIGEEKEREDREVAQISGPAKPKLLKAPQRDIPDDIPF